MAFTLWNLYFYKDSNESSEIYHCAVSIELFVYYIDICCHSLATLGLFLIKLHNLHNCTFTKHGLQARQTVSISTTCWPLMFKDLSNSKVGHTGVT